MLPIKVRSDVSEGSAITSSLDAKNITHARFVCAGLAAEKDIVIARSKAIAGTPPHNSVVVAGGENSNARRPTAMFSSPLVRAVSAMLPRAVLAPSIPAVGAIETCQRGVTDSDVSFAGCVFPERIGTDGRVKTGGGVVPHRCSANSGEMVAGGVLEAPLENQWPS